MNKSALEIFIALHNTKDPDKAFPEQLCKLSDNHLAKISLQLFSDIISYPRRAKFNKAVLVEINLLTIKPLDQKIHLKLQRALKNV